MVATATRIYHVNIEGIAYLVRATHSSAALTHATRKVSSVRVATQDDLVLCIADGVKVQDAKEDDAPESAQLPGPGPTDEEEESGGGHAEGAPAAAARQRMPVKYRCADTGSTWSGRGRPAGQPGRRHARDRLGGRPAAGCRYLHHRPLPQGLT
jgi:hypothetical protein